MQLQTSCTLVNKISSYSDPFNTFKFQKRISLQLKLNLFKRGNVYYNSAYFWGTFFIAESFFNGILVSVYNTTLLIGTRFPPKKIFFLELQYHRVWYLEKSQYTLDSHRKKMFLATVLQYDARNLDLFFQRTILYQYSASD